jgi:uncharacterized membrane protein YjgN (DUF898 family)
MKHIKRCRFRFHGSGSKLFGIFFLNLIFIVLTLGIYYPWARAKLLQYLYGETELEGSRFQFHGTGKEIFWGFVKAIALLALLYAILTVFQFSAIEWVKVVSIILYFVAFLALIPFAIHGSLRYRLSRTSYKGIHFGYRGKLRELYWLMWKGLFLSAITLGIYTPWFTVSLRKYIINHIRAGDVKLTYDGTGWELFVIAVKGVIFSFLTLGIYMFWYLKNTYHFYVNHVVLIQNDTPFRLKTNITAANILVITIATYAAIFTLGLALPWVIIYSYRVFFDSVSIEEGFDPEAIAQTEESYQDATGEDLSEMLDIGVV